MKTTTIIWAFPKFNLPWKRKFCIRNANFVFFDTKSASGGMGWAACLIRQKIFKKNAKFSRAQALQGCWKTFLTYSISCLLFPTCTQTHLSNTNHTHPIPNFPENPVLTSFSSCQTTRTGEGFIINDICNIPKLIDEMLSISLSEQDEITPRCTSWFSCQQLVNHWRKNSMLPRRRKVQLAMQTFFIYNQCQANP